MNKGWCDGNIMHIEKVHENRKRYNDSNNKQKRNQSRSRSREV